jgi:signal transduction histidine kinase
MSEITDQLEPRATELEVSPEHLQQLLEIGAKLSSTLHLNDLLAMVMAVATDLTSTQTASILLLDDTTGHLHFAASTGGAIPEDIIVPLDNSIAGWVVRHGRSVILGNVRSDSRFYATVDKDLQFVTESMLAVPLMANDKAIGALEVINKKNDEAYTSQDVALMEVLASQSAVAIMNARLFNQSDLLAEIMHELKTPMMAIRSASQLLTRPDLPADKHMPLIEMIQRESVRLSNMTKDFLDFARLESGRTRIAHEPVDITRLVHEIVSIQQPQASTRGLEIDVAIADDTPKPTDDPMLEGDYDRLKQVLLNLVSNAIKYNRENGRITIIVKKRDNCLALSVSDTGKGITPEDQEHLFERFYRIPGSENQSEGSGLGLSIAKKIAEEHDGRIEVESVLDEGTTFTIILPLTAVKK